MPSADFRREQNRNKTPGSIRIEQHELLVAMLRRTRGLSESLITDQQLVGIADELFQQLDVEESNDTITEQG